MGLKKQIIQFKDGEQVAVYNSATDAANAIESTKSNISKCCLGKLKQVNGFTFKYSVNSLINKKMMGNINAHIVKKGLKLIMGYVSTYLCIKSMVILLLKSNC